MLAKLKSFLVKLLQFFLNPRFLLCFGIGWLITNGWSYILFAMGTFYEIPWMIAVSSAYLTFLWLPISPEKIVTIAIAMFLLKKLFPGDKKTLGVLQQMYASAKAALQLRREKRKAKKIQQNTGCVVMEEPTE